MKAFILQFFLILTVLQAGAVSVLLEIRERETGKSIDGAFVIYETTASKKRQAISDGKGLAKLENVKVPSDIIVRLIGYEAKQIKMTDEALKDGALKVLLEKSTTQMQDVVVTGQAQPVLAQQSVYKVNTVSATQIRQRGAVSLNDVLNFEIGQLISNDNLLGSSVSMGGIGGQNVKILVNGIPLNGRENGNIDVSQINLANIKRIEMIQGPMSVMYGSNALGGVINLISQNPKKGFSIGARTFLESIGRYNFSGDINLNHKRHSLQISTARNFFQGWTPEDTLDRYQVWKPKTQYTTDAQYLFQKEKWSLNYYTSYVHEKITNKGIPIISSYEGYAFDEYYRTQRFMNSLGATIKIGKSDEISLINTYSIYHRIKNRFRKDLVTLEQFPTLSVGDQDTSRFNSINLRGTYSSSHFKHLQLLAGYEYSNEVGKSYKLSDKVKEYSDLGLFASGLYTFRKVSLQPSMRVTLTNRYEPAWTPAVHTKWDINSNNQIRISYAKGFRAPTMKEMYLQFIDQNHTIIGNPDLKPENGHHVEFNVDHRYSINKAKGLVSFQASHNRIQNMITLAVYDGHGVLRRYENIASYKNWIANLKAGVSINSLSVQQGLGLTWVEEADNIPGYTFLEYSLNAGYTINPIQSTVNFNYKFNSKQAVRTVDDQILFTSPIHIANISIQRGFFKNAFMVQAGVKNLFNLQNTNLTGAVDAQGNAHTSASGMQVFPARSLFFDLSYRINQQKN